MALIRGSSAGESLNGTSDDDVIFGLGGKDTIDGGDGSDLIVTGGGGSDVIDGGIDIDGHDTDTVVLNGAFAAYNVSFSGSTVSFTTGVGPSAVTEQMTHVESVAFDDQVVRIVGAGSAYTTIQQAIDGASDGDIILVEAGSYQGEALHSDKNLTILGAQHGVDGTARDATSAAGESNFTGHFSITGSGDVTFDGFRFEQDASANDGSGLVFINGAGTGDITFSHNVLYSDQAGTANDTKAFYVNPSSDRTVTLTDNYVTGAAHTGYTGASFNRGIYFDGGDGAHLDVQGNTFEYTRSINLDMGGASTATVSGNTFHSDGTAIAVGIDLDGLTIGQNDYTGVGDEFNVRNIPFGITFDAQNSVGVTDSPINILGGLYADDLKGSAGADIIDGYARTTNDTANDTLEGRGGDDILVAGNYDTNSTSSFSMAGVTGNGGGNDLLIGGSGNDTLVGGADTDTAQFAGAMADYTVADAVGGLYTVTDHVGTDGVDTLAGVERLQFSDHNLLIVGAGGFATIQQAIDAASDGDVIRVDAGSYGDAVNVNKDVTILGANAGVDGSAARGAETVITTTVQITAAGATLDGVTVNGTDGLTHGTDLASAIDVEASNVSVVNSVLTGDANDTRPISVFGGVENVDISHNLIHGWGEGIYVVHGDTGSIADNVFTDNGNGVVTESTGVVISGNDFSGSVGADIAPLPFEDVDLSTVITDDNTFNSGHPRPITIYANGGGVHSITGTDYAETVIGDYATGPLTVHGMGGDDKLFGTASSDVLDGGTGNDTLAGADGGDTATFSGAFADYSIAVASGGLTVTDNKPSDGNDGTDTLTSVEALQFSDRHVLIVDKSGQNGVTTIQAALDQAVTGDIIMVMAGSYDEDLSVTKAVTILGAHAGEAGTAGGRGVANGTGEASITGQMTVNTSGLVTLDGLRLVNDAGSNNVYGLVHLSGGSLDVENSVFYSTVVGGASEARAVYIGPGSNSSVTVADNYITGAFASGYSGASFQRGVWFDGGSGVSLDVHGNTIENTRSGINLDMSGGATASISGNTFDNDGTGVAVGVTSAGVTFGANAFNGVGDEFNFRNLSDDVTFDAGSAVGAHTPDADFIVVLGGGGSDHLTGSNLADYLTGNDLSASTTDADTLVGLGGGDMLAGQGGNDRLEGGDGADTLVGGAGADTLIGGAGVDSMVGGAGDDQYTVNNANEAVVEAAGEGTDTVLVSLGSYNMTAEVENLTYTGAGAFKGRGNEIGNLIQGGGGADALTGGGGADTLIGGDGADTLSGGAATDSLVGGAGGDIYLLSNQADTVVEAAGGGFDTVQTDAFNLDLRSYSNIEAGRLTGTDDLRLTGDGSDNRLTGNEGANRILGGLGQDTMMGGGGNDTFAFTSVNDSPRGARDLILDFHQGEDMIDLLAIDAKESTPGVNNAFSFIGDAAFTGEGQIRATYNAGNNSTLIELNTNANLRADMQITLAGHVDLNDGDFIL